MTSLLWFRGTDLRLADQAAVEACSELDALLAVAILSPDASRANHRAFLLESCEELALEMERRGGSLVVTEGDPLEWIPDLAAQYEAAAVHGIRGTAPEERRLDDALENRLECDLVLHDAATLHPPGTLRTGAGDPYSVFTPFARAFRERVDVTAPRPAPDRLPDSPELPTLPAPTPGDSSADILRGGESEAMARLEHFLDVAADYPEHRDRMDLAGTSRLSADLKFGTVSPRQVWHAIQEALGNREATRVFQNELLWREFNASTLWDRPSLLSEPFRAKWTGFPWRDDSEGWTAWTEGRTGFPIVDASARQLLAEGFVHNRARMISASFLTKHLLIDYAMGESHYMEHLTDGDPAQNNAGWQWSAGCGCDAQPWFRIFNPMTQGKKFDPDGEYVRRWIPELEALPARWIHEPWLAPSDVLEEADVELGESYPHPIVDHGEARERFLRVAKSHLG